jgi:phytol kinase
MKLTFLISLSVSVIFGVEFLKRKFSLSTTHTRRVIHIGTAVVAGLAPLFVSKGEIVLVSIIFALLLFIGRSKHLFSAIHTVDRHTFGEVYLPLGVAVSALLFLPLHVEAFQFGIFIMGLSDAVGGLVGEKFGKRAIMIFGNKKTVEGSATFFAVSLLLTVIFAPLVSSRIFLVSAILTLVELVFVYGLDNLVLPIMGALLFKLLF